MFAHNPKVIPGVHLIFRRQNKATDQTEYLIHERKNTRFFDGHYSVPGGHINGYETPIDCVIREAAEELGIVLKQEYFNYAGVIYRLKESDNEVRIDFCFIIDKWDGKFKNIEIQKHGDSCWFPSNKLPEPMVPYVKEAIHNIESGIPFTITYL